MLYYSLYILEKISFNKELFSKELQKALAILEPSEISILKNWFSVFTQDKAHLQDLEIYFPNRS